MSWKGLILVSGLLGGLSRFFIKDQVGRMGVFQMGFWQDFWKMVMLLGLMGWLGMRGEWWQAGLIMVYGLVVGIGIGAFNSAVREDLSGTTVLSYTLSQIGIVVGATLLLGEWRYFDFHTSEGWHNLLVLGLGLGGFLVYSGVKLWVKWSRMVLLSVLINVGANLLTKKVMDLGWDVVFVLGWQEVGMWLVSWLMLRKRGQEVVREVGGVGYAVMQLGGLGIYLKLMQTQPLSMLSIMRRVSIIGASLVVAFVGFGEHKKLSWRQVVGLGLGLLAFVV